MTTRPTIYYVATGCLYPSEKYNQNIHKIGQTHVRNNNHYTKEELAEYITQDIAWKISLNSSSYQERFPSLKYVKTGELHCDEPFDPNIHKSGNRNIRYTYSGIPDYFYDPLFISE